jgi:5,10-methylenetetrahydromethanopterin reductase
LPVQGESKVPVDVFGSGPHVIDAGARLGDKITVAVGAEPERIAWAVRTAREAGRAAGLDPEALDICAFVVVGAGTDRRALGELVRGNASISAHFQRDVTSSLSSPDATVVEEVTSRYDNYHHGLEHAAQAEVIPADFLSRFCLIGSPEACTERLCRLVELGLSRLVIVGGSRDIDATVRERSDHLVAREILPALQAVALPGKPAELGIDL